MIVEIDQKSGFCFGVVNAVRIAEDALNSGIKLYSLGHIVHNDLEVSRLRDLGLETITHEEFFKLKNCRVLIRAHGEPPSTYEYARLNQISLIDATCPVVSKLQQRVKNASELMEAQNGQVVIFGHQDHAEVTGLAGQTKISAIIIEKPDDYRVLDPERPVVVFSQTTKSVADFKKLSRNIQEYSHGGSVETHDTVCRQVSNREPHLEKFVAKYDVVLFVGGLKSSNARVLFAVCKANNPNSYFVTSPEDLQPEWFLGVERVGICGATSTPQWLMEKVAQRLEQL